MNSLRENGKRLRYPLDLKEDIQYCFQVQKKLISTSAFSIHHVDEIGLNFLFFMLSHCWSIDFLCLTQRRNWPLLSFRCFKMISRNAPPPHFVQEERQVQNYSTLQDHTGNRWAGAHSLCHLYGMYKGLQKQPRGPRIQVPISGLGVDYGNIVDPMEARFWSNSCSTIKEHYHPLFSVSMCINVDNMMIPLFLNISA